MDRKKLFFSNAELRKLILPLVVDQFLQAFVGLADSVMVSSVGEAAVSGVSLIDTVMILIINIYGSCHRRSSHRRPVPGQEKDRNGLQSYKPAFGFYP